jgi:4a-hydroxytetrahydrobiopterin dehydratase
MSDPITIAEFHASGGTTDWRVVSEGAMAFFRTRSLDEGARLAERIAEIDGVEDSRPAIDLRRDSVTVRLVTITDEYMGMTSREVELARRISAIARDIGIVADPSRIQSFLVIPGAPDITTVVPFWRAVLGYDPRPDSPDEDLVDPRDRGPAFWFEGMEQPRADGDGAIHVAVWVAPERAEARVAAALAAGGRLVRDDYAPAWWTLADAAGNEVDVATTQGRD